jgi:hypothetical protein
MVSGLFFDLTSKPDTIIVDGKLRFDPGSSDAEKIPGVLGMQNVLSGVSMAVGVMEMALYSSYTH